MKRIDLKQASKNVFEKQNAYIYVRTSTKTQNIQEQLNQCKNYALKNNYKIVQVFSDEGFLATPERPAFQDLINALENDKQGVVIISHVDRLFKRDKEKFQEFLFKYHVRSVN